MEATKKCPHCGETIKAEAKKCRHCRRFFDSQSDERATDVAPAETSLQPAPAIDVSPPVEVETGAVTVDVNETLSPADTLPQEAASPSEEGHGTRSGSEYRPNSPAKSSTKTKIIVACAVALVLIFGLIANAQYQKQITSQAEANIQLNRARLEYAMLADEVEKLSKTKKMYVFLKRRFDTQDGKGFYEAFVSEFGNWSGRKKSVVIADEDTAEKQGREFMELMLLPLGEQPVTMTNSNAYRTWTSTEYFPHWEVVTSEYLEQFKEKLVMSQRAVVEAQNRVTGAAFFWQRANADGLAAPNETSPAVGTVRDESAKKIIESAESPPPPTPSVHTDHVSRKIVEPDYKQNETKPTVTDDSDKTNLSKTDPFADNNSQESSSKRLLQDADPFADSEQKKTGAKELLQNADPFEE